MPPPNSLKELALPRYTYKVLTPPGLEQIGPDYMAIKKQGRIVTNPEGKRWKLKASYQETSFVILLLAF